MKHTYLFPGILRRGQPVNTFVTKELKGYWLGTYHDMGPDDRPYQLAGNVRYNSVSKVRISKEFYDAFLAESRFNHRRFRSRSSADRTQVS